MLLPVFSSFSLLIFKSSSELGSPTVVYNCLLEVGSKSRTCQDPISHHGQSCGPGSGNHEGSYLMMLSSGGLVFGIINIVDNVLLNQEQLLSVFKSIDGDGNGYISALIESSER